MLSDKFLYTDRSHRLCKKRIESDRIISIGLNYYSITVLRHVNLCAGHVAQEAFKQF